ncbi:MAG: hypothetical protein RR420_01230 [Anaerovoracaceae bacterium]
MEKRAFIGAALKAAKPLISKVTPALKSAVKPAIASSAIGAGVGALTPQKTENPDGSVTTESRINSAMRGAVTGGMVGGATSLGKSAINSFKGPARANPIGLIEAPTIKTASEEIDFLFRYANDQSDDKKSKGLIGGAIGAGMMYGAKDRVLGQKTLYHGTSSSNWDNIKKDGLRVDKGGSGASSVVDNVGPDGQRYSQNSAGKVHLTGDRSKAQFYSGVTSGGQKRKNELNELDSKIKELDKTKKGFMNYDEVEKYRNTKASLNKQKTKIHFQNAAEGFNPFNKDKKIVKIKMGYDKYKKLDIDMDEQGGGLIESLGKDDKTRKKLERPARHMASTSSQNVGKDEIVGLHKTTDRLKSTFKNMPDYIKNNKGRFATGVAMGTVGAGLIGRSIKNNIQNFNKEKTASEEIDFIFKYASEKKLVIPEIEQACKDPVEKKVAYMMATSHEYKKPNVLGALRMVKNYKWELSREKISNLQGIDKPIKDEKVRCMLCDMSEKDVKPFIVVNQFHGIRPQTPGKKILLDGHHRKVFCKYKGMDTVDVYKGTYTGAAEKKLKDFLKE